MGLFYFSRFLLEEEEEAVKRNRKRNKLLPRERIDKLIDPGSSFLELSQAATVRGSLCGGFRGCFCALQDIRGFGLFCSRI
ncbi:hypothetical protein NC653_024068 [Populus alba x Populus x berolinensis]|uniref:Uncharacterized protein n=1 Tax=Populus alba x Populus x berolinensis TaxID=444605 RepID=A0AAD6MJH4_9ROSI|nr:hypothetical protein NC653_024068 [Populus alba x Populus x berolinensis]